MEGHDVAVAHVYPLLANVGFDCSLNVSALRLRDSLCTPQVSPALQRR